MRSSLIAFSSVLLTTAVVWSTYNRKKQFYPTVVYLTNNQPCVAILLFQCAVMMFIFAKLMTKLFFGRLQQAEVDNLVSQSWYAFFDMCLVFAFFQDELGTDFLFFFSVLMIIRAFHWLIEERVDYMERTPVLNTLFHIRVLTLMLALAVIDCYYIKITYWKPAAHGLSVHLALGIEYFILLLNLFSVAVRYVLHSIDSMRDHPWDKKTMYLLYVDIIVGIARLAFYVEFTVLMWTLHPFPLFIARPIYLSVRSLKKAIRDVLMSRRAIRYMNTVFRDATAEDLAASSDTVCIICREEMQLTAAGSQSNQNTILKRLPCGHIFHVSCLRSWFQRQQTCPTCRMDIIREARQQELQGTQAQQRGPIGRAPVSGTPSTSTGPTAPEVHARPPWMQGLPGFNPYFPPFLGTSIPQTTSAGSFTPFPPPFIGMPIIYPGNLFPNPTTPMPEPPSGIPDHVLESRLRASANARLTALRQINVLLNAAVLQMNAYLNASTDSDNPWMNAFTTGASDVKKNECETKDAKNEATEVLDTKDTNHVTEGMEENDALAEVRKRRLERFGKESEEVKAKDD